MLCRNCMMLLAATCSSRNELEQNKFSLIPFVSLGPDKLVFVSPVCSGCLQFAPVFVTSLTLREIFFLCLVSPGSCSRQSMNWLLSVTSTSCCQRTAVAKERHWSRLWAAGWDRSWTINRKCRLSPCCLSPSRSPLPSPLCSFPLSPLLITSPLQSNQSSQCVTLQ